MNAKEELKILNDRIKIVKEKIKAEIVLKYKSFLIDLKSDLDGDTFENSSIFCSKRKMNGAIFPILCELKVIKKLSHKQRKRFINYKWIYIGDINDDFASAVLKARNEYDNNKYKLNKAEAKRNAKKSK